MKLCLIACLLLVARGVEGATRDEFVSDAGGVFTATAKYNSGSSRKIYLAFWDYWGSTTSNVLTAYVEEADVEAMPEEVRHCAYANEIHGCKNAYSVEHIVPKSWMRAVLADDEEKRYGAENNVFNWAPALRYMNSRRNNYRYDTEDDAVTRNVTVAEYISDIVTTAEFDAEGEFVVPRDNRGELARAVLYMALVYNELSADFTRDEIDTYRAWSLADPPLAWETAYNTWANASYSIENPLIVSPGTWEADEDVWTSFTN